MSRLRITAAGTLVFASAGMAFFAAKSSGSPRNAFKQLNATPLTPKSTYVGAKSLSGYVAQTDPSLLGRTDSTPINVMIKYDYDPTASYSGTVAGLAATSPGVTGKKLNENKGAVDAYEQHAKGVSQKITAAIQQAVPGAKIRGSFVTVYGGVAAQVPANKVGDLLRVQGVVAVQKDSLEHPLDDNTDFIGATKVWPQLGGSTTAGSNVTVGVIDTGVWPEHPMLSSTGIPAPADGLKGCEFGDGSDPALGPSFTCNNKLIGAYAKTATYMAAIGSNGHEFCNNTTGVCSPRDPEGHGTHTTTTAAGDKVTSAILYGVERGPVSGIAPGAHVIMFRVCLAQGCFSSDSVSAVDQAINDGVDVINFSISGGANPYTDPVEQAFLDAFNAGISVNASAGNSGPGAGTSDHGGPWTTTVGASTGPRSFTSTLHLTADGGATLDVPGVTLTNGITSPTPVVLATGLAATSGTEDELCDKTLAAGAASGKVVVCKRGNNGRIDKGRRVLAGGAAGMILYNQSAAVTDLESDNHYLPAIQTQFDSNSIANFVTSHTNVVATWAQGTATPSQPDVMASFSSRGPTGDFIKPDVTAPGIQVLAGTTPQPDQTTADNGPPGNFFMAIAGTSMSSPHAAGVSALVKATHPNWTPAMIKSALMTSSLQSVVKEDGATPADPFDMGSGSIRADRAVNPTLVFNETAAHYAAAANDPLNRINLNLPSIDAPTMAGTITTNRTAINVSGLNQSLKVSTSAPAGATITVGTNNSPIGVSAGQSVTFPITISAATLAEGQYFGRITLTPNKGGSTPVTIPVAFFKHQGAVTLSHTCSPTTVGVNQPSNCTASMANFAAVTANVNLNITASGGLKYGNVSAPATVNAPRSQILWSGTLSPALPPTVDSITPTTGPAGGYLPIAGFSGSAIVPAGDDTISNFNTDTFYYGGEPYSRIGVVSNGYVVLGGGTSADIVFPPQSFPNSARPNNVVALLWSDLNTAGGGGAGRILINELSDGNDAWLVVDYEGVKNFSDATTHTFELWFRLAGFASGAGAESEQVTMTYSSTANTSSPDPGTGGNSGAENRTGTSGVNLTPPPANGSEWSVNTSPPTAGGTQIVTYSASAGKPGTYTSVANMTSNITPGTTQKPVTLTVTP